jgi:hypothetical protein
VGELSRDGGGRPFEEEHNDEKRGDEEHGDEASELARKTAERDDDQGEPDVLLHVPIVKVDEISLEVDQLRAQVSLHAAVGKLVSLNVGAEVEIGRVHLTIKGVEARALLKVRLENVERIIERTLATVDKNPQLLQSVLEPLGQTVGMVGETARDTVPQLGQSVGKTVEETVPEVGRDVGKTVKDTVPAVGGVARAAADSAGKGAGVGPSATSMRALGRVRRTARSVSGSVLRGAKQVKQKVLRRRRAT